MSNWAEREYTITLTGQDLFDLVNYLEMSKTYRKDEIEKWERMAAEKTDAGAPRFVHAASNAQFLAERDERLEALRKKLDEQGR